MGEILDFESFRKRSAEETADSSEKPDERAVPIEDEVDLRGRLEEAPRRAIVDLLKLANRVPLAHEKAESQREILRGWSDEEVVEFANSMTNLREIRNKPHLIIALYERLTGRI